jgi:predicted nucleic acid-binding protein
MSYINLIDVSLDYPPSNDLSFNITAVNIVTNNIVSPIIFYPNVASSKTSLRFKSNTSSPLFLTVSSVESWKISVTDKSTHDHDDQYKLNIALEGQSAQGIVNFHNHNH